MGKMKDLLPQSQIDLGVDPLCRCGHELESHQWNINLHPEGEPDWELLNCKECGEWTYDGDYLSDCSEYYPEDKE